MAATDDDDDDTKAAPTLSKVSNLPEVAVNDGIDEEEKIDTWRGDAIDDDDGEDGGKQVVSESAAFDKAKFESVPSGNIISKVAAALESSSNNERKPSTLLDGVVMHKKETDKDSDALQVNDKEM